jgi:hypothetical protein
VSLDVEARCTTIEVNHFYDDLGELRFTQLIFWDGGNVCDWRMMSQRPKRNWHSGEWEATWLDKDGSLVTVRAPLMRETWTQVDPEFLERDFWPHEHRRQLRKMK